MLIYLTFSVGLVIGYHFCGGKLDQISVFKGPKDCCPDANSENSCCQNSSLVLKITTDYTGDTIFPIIPGAKFVALVQEASINTVTSITKSKQWLDSHEIKHSVNLPIYIANRVFIV